VTGVARAGRAARTVATDSVEAGPSAYTAGMDGNGTSTSQSHSLEQLLLAGLGWFSLTAEAIDDLADDLARRVGVERDEMRRAVRDTVAGWRAEADRIGTLPSDATDKAIGRLGLVRREETEDLALRVAQLELRVRLLEKD
jgi:polyhydroxyalkanoate synthesis regulator phasin